MRRKVSPDIRKIKGSNGKPLSYEEQRHLSELLDILKTKFGIDIHFQKDRNGEIRGYGIVDHNRKMALDGSKMMKLSELIDFAKEQERKVSSLDIYRDLFYMEIRKSDADSEMTIRLFDGSEHTRKMSPRQSAWYFNSPESEREDVAIRIAATMFSTEIFESVLQKYPVSDINSRIASVNIIKMRDGGRAIRVVSADAFSATYPMTAEELRCHARLQGEDANGYLRQLAILRITHEDATELTNRIKELTAKSTGSITLPLRQSDYTPEQTKAFLINAPSLLVSYPVTFHPLTPRTVNGKLQAIPLQPHRQPTIRYPTHYVVLLISVVRTAKSTNPTAPHSNSEFNFEKPSLSYQKISINL